MREIKISPSILSCDFSRLGEDVKKSEEGGAEYLHIDVMDGIFVPNISFGAIVPKALRKHSKQVFDVHLMIVDPLRYIDDFAAAGADIITIHYESCQNQKETLEYIRSKGIRPAISIKPKTDPAVLREFLPYVDMVLVMTVEPGFGGQSFIPETEGNIRAVRDMIREGGYDIDIEVDGGISAKNVERCTGNGANIIVAGSAVFGSEDVAGSILALRQRAEETFRF